MKLGKVKYIIKVDYQYQFTKLSTYIVTDSNKMLLLHYVIKIVTYSECREKHDQPTSGH